MKHFLIDFVDCKSGDLLLTRRSGTLRRAGNKKLYVHEVFLKRKLLDSSSNPAHIPATNQGVVSESFNNKGNIAKILQKIISAKFD